MIPLTPSFLIAAANTLIGLREEGLNRGQMVELFLRGVHRGAGQPWPAAFVHHVGYWSHFDHEARKSSWPLPATASCYVLARDAKRLDVLRDEPQDGDVFLLWNVQRASFEHTGIVACVRREGEKWGRGAWYDCDTIEAKRHVGVSTDGGVRRCVRRFYPKAGDRFIRWADLDQRSLVDQPAQTCSGSPTSRVA